MKLAIVSNLFPPKFIGGYELGAARVAAEFRRLGHEVVVFSNHWYFTQTADGFARVEQPPSARRGIVNVGPYLKGSLVQLGRRSPPALLDALVSAQLARRGYHRALRELRPDAVWVYNPACLFAPVLEDLETLSAELGFALNAYVSDTWLADWPAPSLVRVELWDKLAARLSWLRRPVRRFAAALGFRELFHPRFDRVAYASGYLRRVSRPGVVGTPAEEVLPWGVPEVAQRRPMPTERFSGTDPLRLVYVGQVARHKGLHVLLDALRLTKRPHRLTVLGDDANEYGRACHARAADLGGRVRFLGRVAPEAVAGATQSAGEVLVLPSIWDEPYSLVVLEAMALGMVVLASDTGGTAEAFSDGVEAFLVPADDPAALAARIDAVEADRTGAAEASRAARLASTRTHTLERHAARLLEHPPGTVARPIAA